MDRVEIVEPGGSGEAVFSGFMEKWQSVFKMVKMVTRGRLSIHVQKVSKRTKEWGEGQWTPLRGDSTTIVYSFSNSGRPKCVPIYHPGEPYKGQ